MIDTLRIRLPFKTSIDSLTNPTQKSTNDGVLYLTSYRLGNLKVTHDELYNTTVIDGSIRKYFLGKCQLRDLYDHEYAGVFAKLCNDLKIEESQLASADLLRLDIGVTFPVKIPVSSIVPNILSKSRLEKGIFPNGVQFKGANKKLIFYDKIKESTGSRKCKKADVKYYDDTIEDYPNLLRFELQLTKLSALRKQLLGVDNLNSIFHDGALTRQMGQFLLKEIKDVKFQLMEVTVSKPLSRSNQILEALLLLLNKESDINTRLEEMVTSGVISPAQKRSVIDKLQKRKKEIGESSFDLKKEIISHIQIRADNEVYNKALREKLDKIIG